MMTMNAKTKRSDDEMLAEIAADTDRHIGPSIDGAPVRAITAAVQRREDAEVDIAAHVAAAREAGFSWGVIGEALGITRQGALKRYGD